MTKTPWGLTSLSFFFNVVFKMEIVSYSPKPKLYTLRKLPTEATANRKSIVNEGERTAALRLLNAWGALLPIRIAKEDLGDYIEDIHRRAENGEWILLWLRVLTALIWTSINVLGFVKRNQLGKETEARSDKRTTN